MIVPEVALLLEQSKHAANGRVARCVRKLSANFSRGCAAEAVDDVHYLPLARAEIFHRLNPGGYIGNMSIH
jgi:hypothetical protein